MQESTNAPKSTPPNWKLTYANSAKHKKPSNTPNTNPPDLGIDHYVSANVLATTSAHNLNNNQPQARRLDTIFARPLSTVADSVSSGIWVKDSEISAVGERRRGYQVGSRLA